jgi:hypothetical protein
MEDLTWYAPWPWAVYDEPEDAPNGWPTFLAAHAKEPIAVAHWDIAKAQRLGVWAEDLPNLAVLIFNWYPATDAVPWWGRWAYVPFKALEYRLRYSRRRVPCYLSLWRKERGDGTDEYGYQYWYSRFWNAWSYFWFRLLLWPRPTGRAWF